MSTHRLTSAMDDYLATLASLQQWDLSGEDSTQQRQQVQAARRRLLEEVDYAAAEATGNANDETADVVALPYRILVALDDSNHATWSVRAASNLARLTAAEIVLLHVINPTAPLSADYAPACACAEIRAVQRQRAGVVLESAAALVPSTVHVDQLVREGDAAQEIVAAAREWEADLIVMGTRGRGRLATFLLGSTAESVIRTALCPVVTVGHDPSAVPSSPRPTAARELVEAV